MKGSNFKVCTRCDRRINKARKCEHCGYTRYSWAFVVDIGVRSRGGRQVKRQGFATHEAEAALTDVVERSQRTHGSSLPSDVTTGAFLIDRWIPRMRVRPSTAAERRVHINAYVIPRIGDIPLEELTGDDLTQMYDDFLVNGRTQRAHPELGWGLSPTTVRHINTILHRAFQDAIRWGILDLNPCVRADPPSTAAVTSRAQAARSTWSWDELRTFVQAIQDDRLYAMWHLFTTTGMRRGEVAGLRWPESDLDEGLIAVLRNAVTIDSEVIESDLPKTASSCLSIELGDADIDVLRRHRDRQEAERQARADLWQEPERVFATELGERLDPPWITREFHRLTEEAGVPRIRLQYLRHTHATLMLKSGEKVKVISERLGHSPPRVHHGHLRGLPPRHAARSCRPVHRPPPRPR